MSNHRTARSTTVAAESRSPAARFESHLARARNYVVNGNCEDGLFHFRIAAELYGMAAEQWSQRGESQRGWEALNRQGDRLIALEQLLLERCMKAGVAAPKRGWWRRIFGGKAA